MKKSLTASVVRSFAALAMLLPIAGMSASGQSRDLPEGMTDNGEIVEATPATVGERVKSKDSKAAEVFMNLDVRTLDLLSKETREYMLLYWDSDSITDVANELNGLSHLDTVTNDYLKVTLTDASTLEIKILPLKKGGTVAMTVYTIGDSEEAPDSEIKFWDSSLKELPASKFFKTPVIADFFSIPKGCATTMKEIREMIAFPTVEYNASADSDSLTARLSVEKRVAVDDYNILKLFLKPALKYEWNGSRFTSSIK